MKVDWSRIWTFLVVSKLRLADKVKQLQQENADLRGRLSALQHAKQLAEKEAEELRSQKERLRARASSLKKDLEAQRRLLEQAHEKIASLREENRALLEEPRGSYEG